MSKREKRFTFLVVYAAVGAACNIWYLFSLAEAEYVYTFALFVVVLGGWVHLFNMSLCRVLLERRIRKGYQ